MAANPQHVGPANVGKSRTVDMASIHRAMAKIQHEFNGEDEEKSVTLSFKVRDRGEVVEDLPMAIRRSVRGDDGPPYRDMSKYPYRAPLIPDQVGVA